ncbi:MAG: uracil-DNA glycosylase [Rhodothermales bacterium]|nr:uracil-DNA glycosylase [Rhodothermales bacterium]
MLEQSLFELDPLPDTFNPYTQRNPEVDRVDAVAIRRANLARYFEACDDRPLLFLLAEAPGPWGCRFSGVPITSEAQLLDPSFPIDGAQSSLREEAYSEYSANIFWGLLQDAFPKFVVWNAFPLHPYRPGKPFTIRPPRRTELRRFEELTARLIEVFAPRRVLSVGRKAERTLSEISVDATYVRHPSQGGATLFREGVQKALKEVRDG